jgi:NAD(P)-dependent dehydrogenase (short-subunit alcohol dehydrogenase family)
MRRFEARVVLIAGAGSVPDGLSIGMATAMIFAREGAKVFALDRDAARNEVTRSAILARGGDCVAFTADVSSEEEVRAAVATCTALHGRIDVLFNNVGLQIAGGPEEIEEEAWDRVMAANVRSMFLTCRHVLPLMAARGAGVVLNVSSFVAEHFIIPNIAYAASKGAVEALTRNVAVQYAPRGIRAAWITPGILRTPRLEARLRAERGDAVEAEFARRDAMVPLGRMGEAQDVAEAAAFLASDAARYITATGLTVDGGLGASILGRQWAPPAACAPKG